MISFRIVTLPFTYTWYDSSYHKILYFVTVTVWKNALFIFLQIMDRWNISILETSTWRTLRKSPSGHNYLEKYISAFKSISQWMKIPSKKWRNVYLGVAFPPIKGLNEWAQLQIDNNILLLLNLITHNT